jgi:hypothetical protein
VSTRRRGHQFILVCFDVLCTIDANVRPVFGLWRAVADAVTVAPQQSASQLLRNLQLAESPTKHIEPLLLRCMQRVVRASRVQLTVKQLQGFNIDSSFESLAKFSDVKWFRTLVDRHNDPEDDFHFNMYSAFVIGRDLNAARDIVHINVTVLLPRCGFYPTFFAKSPPDGFFG